MVGFKTLAVNGIYIVPFICRLFHETDWYPTILSLAGGDIPDGLDGVDQSAMLLDGADSARDELVLNLDQYTPCLFGRGAIR